ncbi:hypothetical protein F383_16523 [Gossypium arboreum]|uniref:Uncharacterized protein n=1 Tax=Gossypium arboreum TaxID=29729 RepID=A0A0B0M9P4_GOSAR|nr:hypothetical protein F383_16523 [Gossypium arboreum]
MPILYPRRGLTWDITSMPYPKYVLHEISYQRHIPDMVLHDNT